MTIIAAAGAATAHRQDRRRRSPSRSTAVLLAALCLSTCCAGRGVKVEPVVPIGGDGAEYHQLFTELLAEHVRHGHVAYPALCADQRLAVTIARLAGTDPAALPGDTARLAFWINAYNAFTLKIICDNYPVASINDLHSGGLVLGSVLGTTIWDRKFIAIGGRSLSLNAIEHQIIRPTFADPRAHFALVCASTSCPPLRSEAYDAAHLDAQLDDQARRFLGDPTKNVFDLQAHTAHLSKIFDWYGSDFGDGKVEMLRFVGAFAPDSVRASLESEAEAWSIDFLDYDWSLND